jgi:uncharacterized protein
VNITTQIGEELQISPKQVENAVRLLDEGNTIPFIARYRKEVTGMLDEEQLRQIEELVNYLRNLTIRKEEVLKSIAAQDKLTSELEKAINNAVKLQDVEDLYRPYRPKRRTRATMAREKGLEPLSRYLLQQETEANPEQYAQKFVNEGLGVPDPQTALEGALDILAEEFADQPDYRKAVRSLTHRLGILVTKGKTEEVTTYQMYYDYREPINKLVGHRILAINRGEKEGILSVKIEVDQETITNWLKNKIISNPSSPFTPYLIKGIEDSYKRLTAPAVEREIRNLLTEEAEKGAIRIFSINLKNILLQPPVKGQTVLGIDPGYRTGCKLAVVDDTGKLLETGVIFPTLSQNQVEKSAELLVEMVNRHQVKLIAIGNGTASRETEQFVANLIDRFPQGTSYTIVSEAGASVYSASKLAAEEFPTLDVSQRSGVSIARRLQDPLAELVKIEPKAIGVGQYQHDVNQKELEQSLRAVVESAVNSVGVDLNTASAELLKYVAGIKPQTAKNIVAYREEIGRFTSRKQLSNVPKLGPATFLQCAGFLRISDGTNPLDGTAVHPESYHLAKEMLSLAGLRLDQLTPKGFQELELSDEDLTALARELGAGLPTLRDILTELKKPGRDPRGEMPSAIFKTGITKIEDLEEGMVVSGVVRNVVDFGAFVDLGVKQDGLIHISELSDSFVRHPTDLLAVGDQLSVKIISLDKQRQRIGLTIKPSKMTGGSEKS